MYNTATYLCTQAQTVLDSHSHTLNFICSFAGHMAWQPTRGRNIHLPFHAKAQMPSTHHQSPLKFSPYPNSIPQEKNKGEWLDEDRKVYVHHRGTESAKPLSEGVLTQCMHTDRCKTHMKMRKRWSHQAGLRSFSPSIHALSMFPFLYCCCFSVYWNAAYCTPQ